MIDTKPNQITGPYSAIVNGKATGFAGCSNQACPRDCLRKAPRLADRTKLGTNEHCERFIPANTL